MKGYITDADQRVSRRCDHCEWRTVARSYGALVKQYQDHLRADHPRAWLRT